MKSVLLCGNPYAYGILNPIKEELIKQGDDFLWYVPEKMIDGFPYKDTDSYTTSIKDVVDFKPDSNFVPGNEIPHYIRGVKVQTFHGFAAEKKGHFRIRGYFDLYLTQGPFFTEGFLELKKKHKNFEVTETGWSKLDPLLSQKNAFNDEKKAMLKEVGAEKVVLYAPTFSKSLTSAPFLIEQIKELSKNPKFLVLIKFHDLMKKELVETYQDLAKDYSNIQIIKTHNILKTLILSDLMISDTSSVIYEFLLMDRPVVSFKNSSKNIRWDDIKDPSELCPAVERNLSHDPYKFQRDEIFKSMHPYNDGQSAKRMVDATKKYIAEFGVPEKRKLSFLRRRKINKFYGKY